MTVSLLSYISRYYGLSSDSKPETKIGSLFIETDTLDVYVCTDGTTWTKYCRNSVKNMSSETIRNVNYNYRI